MELCGFKGTGSHSPCDICYYSLFISFDYKLAQSPLMELLHFCNHTVTKNDQSLSNAGEKRSIQRVEPMTQGKLSSK